jgi:hypothetical protein
LHCCLASGFIRNFTSKLQTACLYLANRYFQAMQVSIQPQSNTGAVGQRDLFKNTPILKKSAKGGFTHPFRTGGYLPPQFGSDRCQMMGVLAATGC